MVKKYGELYLQARRDLLPTEGENAAFIARELLSFVTGKTVEQFLADRELYASEETAIRMANCTDRILRGEPLAYILGSWSFYGLPLSISPNVLIPRDDTVPVTELAIEALKEMEPPQRVLDLCTGSGCIGLAIAHSVPTARVTLCDVSADAVKLAKQNISDLKLMGRVSAFPGDVRKPVPKFWGQFDLIVSNPPYITAEEMAELDKSVKDYEPHLALYGGEDGLDFYRAILHNFTSALRPGGVLCLEFGYRQAEAVGELLRAAGYEDLHFVRDSGDIIRAVSARKPE